MSALLGVFVEEIGLAMLALSGAVVCSVGGLIHAVLCCRKGRRRPH